MPKRPSSGKSTLAYLILGLLAIAVAIALWKLTLAVIAIVAIVYTWRQRASALNAGRSNWATKTSDTVWHSRSQRGRLGTLSVGAITVALVASVGTAGVAAPEVAQVPPTSSPLSAATQQIPTVTPPRAATSAPRAAATADLGNPTPVPTLPPIATPAPVATEAPVVTPAPTAVEEPDPEPAPLAVKVTKRTSSVRRGATASITIKTAARSECSITVEYLSGPSQAKGLGNKKATSQGLISWSWKVGTNTTRGSWPIYVECSLGDRYGSGSTEFTVK